MLARQPNFILSCTRPAAGSALLTGVLFYLLPVNQSQESFGNYPLKVVKLPYCCFKTMQRAAQEEQMKPTELQASHDLMGPVSASNENVRPV